MYINSPGNRILNHVSKRFGQRTLQENMLRRMNFPQRARAHTCFPSHVLCIGGPHICMDATDRVSRLHICMDATDRGGVLAEELLHQASEAWGGVMCMQIRATRGGDYAVTCGAGVRSTLHGKEVGGWVHAVIKHTGCKIGMWVVWVIQICARTHDGVAGCRTKADGEGAAEAVFEKHL